MSKVCEVCGKGKAAGNNVTFSHRGIRRTWTPNLRRVKVFDENGTPKRINVCTRCLRSGKVNRNKPGQEPVDFSQPKAAVPEMEMIDQEEAVVENALPENEPAQEVQAEAQAE